MIAPPNSPRPGVVGGFTIRPQAQVLPVSFTTNSTWIGIGGAPSGFAPQVGEELAFTIGDIYSSMPFVVASAFNWRGPWAAHTAYSVNDCFAWFDSGGVVRAWVVTTAFTSGSGFATSSDFREFTFRGSWATGTAYLPGDVVNAPDGSGNIQSWVANSSFTAGGSVFAQGSQWAGALAAKQIFYVVAVGYGTIQISTTQNGAPITFMSSGLNVSPDSQPNLSVYFGVTAFGAGTGLTPALSMGALFAQGVLWRPTTPPAVPAAPTSQLTYLAYNSTGGLYWTTNSAGTTVGDAVLGWVLTNATDILAAENQTFPVANVTGSSFAATGIEAGISLPSDQTPPTPMSGIATAGSGTVSWSPITFSAGTDPSQITGATIVLLYITAGAVATAHLTTALSRSVASGAGATIATDTNLTGVVNNGDWILCGGEMMFVTASSAGTAVTVERALGLTTAENHAVGDPIYLLSTAVFSYTFQPLFFLTTPAASWTATETLPMAAIALFNIVVYADAAESAQGPVNYSQAVGGLIATGSLSSFSLHAETLTPVSGAVSPNPNVQYHVLNVTAAATVGAPAGAINGLFYLEIVQGSTVYTVTFDAAVYESPTYLAQCCSAPNSITNITLRLLTNGKYRATFVNSYIPG